MNFNTKDECKVRQEAAFMKLLGTERVFLFFNLCPEMRYFPAQEFSDKKDNFIIHFKNR